MSAMNPEELDKWWSDYVKAKESEDAELAAITAQWESGLELRQKFAEEVKWIDELSQPVEKTAEAVLATDKSRRGEMLYREWGSINQKEYLYSYYNNELFRAIYTRKRFVNSATSFLQALVYRIIPTVPTVEDFLKNKVKRVISIGCGSGADIAAFVAYTRSRKFENRLVYFAMDQCEQWNQYISAFDKEWAAKYKLTIWFKHHTFGMKRDDVLLLPDADMVVFSFANTARMHSAIWPELKKRYGLIIVLDGVKETVKLVFAENDFREIQLTEKTTVYFHFNPEVLDSC